MNHSTNQWYKGAINPYFLYLANIIFENEEKNGK